MATENLYNNRLQELSGSNYENADGQPDVRGWDVSDDAGNKIGKVKELLFDESSLKVRYLITKLKSDNDDVDGRKVLVPVGVARLHEKDDDIVLPGVTLANLQALPEYDKDSLTSEHEHTIRNIFAGVGGAALAGAGTTGGDDFYNHHHFDEDTMYSNRTANQSEVIPVIHEELQVGKGEVETGRVRLRTRVVEDQVHEDINLREEHVRVERTPVDRPANAADIKEDYIEVRETAEVPVVAKEARVVEEVSLNKDVNVEEKTISDTVRNTEIDVERTGKDSNINRHSDNL